MALPPRTIVYFHYQREANTLTPTTGGLRDARRPEYDHPLGHGWIEELDDGELRLNLAVAGFEIRPMDVAIQHVQENRQQWEEQARTALAELLPECEVVEQPEPDDEPG